MGTYGIDQGYHPIVQVKYNDPGVSVEKALKVLPEKVLPEEQTF